MILKYSNIKFRLLYWLDCKTIHDLNNIDSILNYKSFWNLYWARSVHYYYNTQTYDIIHWGDLIISSFLTLAGRFKKAGGRTSSAIYKGPHPLRLVVDVVGWNQNFFELEPSDGKYLAVI